MKTKVLAMDDSLTVRSVIESTLKSSGYDVYVVSNGQEGIKMAEEIFPDVILVDFVMPKMNGYQVCKKLRSEQQFQETPIFLITARGEEVGKTFSEKFNVSYFIKPFRPAELLEKIEEVTKGIHQEKMLSSEILSEIEQGDDSSTELDALSLEEADLSEEISLPDFETASPDTGEPVNLDQLLNGLSMGASIEPQEVHHDDSVVVPNETVSPSMLEMQEELTLDSDELELPALEISGSQEQPENLSPDAVENQEDSMGLSLDGISLPEGFEGFEFPGEEKQDGIQLKGLSSDISGESLELDETTFLGKEDLFNKNTPSEPEKEDLPELELSVDPLDLPDISLDEPQEAEAVNNTLSLDDNEMFTISSPSDIPKEEGPEISLPDDSMSVQEIYPEHSTQQPPTQKISNLSAADETIILPKGEIKIDADSSETLEQTSDNELSHDSLNIQDISAQASPGPLFLDDGVTQEKVESSKSSLFDDTLNLHGVSYDITEEIPLVDEGVSFKEQILKTEESSSFIDDIELSDEVPATVPQEQKIKPQSVDTQQDSTQTPLVISSPGINEKEIASKVSEVVSRYLINYFECNFLERIEQSLTLNIDRHFTSNVSAQLPLSGDISHFSISLILKVITQAKLKGVLNVFSAGQFAEVYIAKGRIVSANSNKKTKWSFIGQVLKNETKITEEQLAEALEKSIAEKRPLGRVIIELGFASAEDIMLVLERQVMAVVHSLTELKKGKFFFEETEDSEKFTDMPLNLSHDEIMSYDPSSYEGQETQAPSEDWKLVHQRINGHDVYIGVINDFNEIKSFALKPNELKIYSYLDGEKDLDTVVKLSELSYFDVYKSIHNLIKDGLVKKLSKGE